MERIREARRVNAVAGSGAPSGRRHRAADLRDSPEEGSTETFRSRDGASRRERDRDFSDGSKRRRVEESEEDNEMENRRSHSYHSHRKSSLSGRVARPAPPDSTAVDEIVGVAVPRKARSSSAKRSHEYWVSGASPARRSVEAISPATSGFSLGKKKGTLKISKSSSESQENIEIEIAEVLYGLMRQSQTSKKESLAPNPSQKLESNHSNVSAEPVGQREQPTKGEAPYSAKCEASVEVASVSIEIQKVVAEQNLIESGSCRDAVESAETIIMAKEEPPSCSKFDDDFQDPTLTKRTSAVSRDEKQQEQMNCDMKNPGFLELKLEPNLDAPDSTLSKETSVSEVVAIEVEEKKIKSLTIDLEEGLDRSKDEDNVSSNGVEHVQKQQKEKAVPPSSSSSIHNVPCWAKSLLPLGSIDVNTGTSHFSLSQPRKKRCTTHHHIAQNIYLHRQYLETSKLRPAPAGSTPVYDSNTCNLGLMLPAMSPPGEGHAPGRGEKDKRSKEVDDVHSKQLVFQQAPQPALVGNLQHGPAFFFPITQNQAPGARSGVSKSTTSINNAPSSSVSVTRAPPTSTSSPAGAPATSFSYPNMAANGAPPLAYQMPFIGAPPAQAMPFFNGSFYSPQMFQQQQSGSSSSSSHKKLQTQQQWGGAQIKLVSDAGGNNGNKQSSKGGVEIVPQAFTVSFASNGNAAAPNISFFQTLPQAGKQGYQVVAGKNGKELKAGASVQAPLFDNSARTLNFMAPPAIGNWPSSSIAAPIVAHSLNPQQHQLQNRTVIFAQTPNQINAALGQSQSWKTSSARNQASPSASNMASSSSSSRTQQGLNQINGALGQSQSQAWKTSSARNQASQASSMANVASSPSSSRTQQGQNQISFAGAAPASKAGSSTPTSQQTDNQSTRTTTQKSSPVCGRNVPSILMSSRPQHLSELKN